MNERIKELVKQAGGHISIRNLMSNPVQQRESIELWDDRIEKFAELIVKECVELVSVNRDLAIEDGWNVDEAMSIAINDIEDHFGVEE
jgi:acetoacetate decarboxylase